MTEMPEAIRLENMKQYGFGIEAMKQIKVCHKCGNTLSASQQFCTACGHRLPEKSLYDMYKERHKTCPACDTVVTNECDYCPQCGKKIESNTLKTG